MLHLHSDTNDKYQHFQFTSYVKGTYFILVMSGTNHQCPVCFLFCGFNLGIHPKSYLGTVFYSLMPKNIKEYEKKCMLKISQSNNFSLCHCMLAIYIFFKTKSYAML